MLSDLATELKDALGPKPQSRDCLMDQLHCSDRMLRRAVSELRSNGLPVASDSDTKGYWWGDDNDIARTVKEYRSRAFDLLQIADALESGPDLGQMEVSI